MAQPTAAMLVIGDEILSGRTRDSNAHHLAQALTAKGIALTEIRMIPDDAEVITGTVQDLSARVDHLFTSGGIGPTHDDITADCVAAAFGAAIDVREDARTLLAEHYTRTGRELNEARLRMARIPDGAILIDNPVSVAPGFTLKNVHVMAGVPAVFEAMVESVLAGVDGGPRLLSHSLTCSIGEGDLAGPLGKAQMSFPDVAMGSYPFGGGAGAILVLRHSDRTRLRDAVSMLKAELAPLGGVDRETPPD